MRTHDRAARAVRRASIAGVATTATLAACAYLGVPSLDPDPLPAAPLVLSSLPFDPNIPPSPSRPTPVPPGRRDVRDLTKRPEIVGVPTASSTHHRDRAALAVDGDATTVWRGAEGESRWEWTLPFRSPVHLGLIRAWFGDSSIRGIPSAYRWEFEPADAGGCSWSGQWQPLPDGAVDDRHPNEFVHGPRTIHASKQVLFTDATACAVRLVIEASEGGVPPVVRELSILASATSLTREHGVVVRAPGSRPVLPGSRPEAVLDGKYASHWSGDAGRAPWTMEVRLPSPRKVDRIGLRLGYDAVTVDRTDDSGRRFSGAYLPVRYRVELERADGTWLRVRAADPPEQWGTPLPVRRRLVRLAEAETVKALRLTVDEATGPWGEADRALAAPVIRDLSLYASDDVYPVIEPPLFLSVNANPSALTSTRKGGEAYSDGGFARDAYHRLRRIVAGFDSDTRWPADASRARDDGTGRFLECIEGDDPVLGRALLVENSPPPVVMLSGGFSWTMDERTAPDPARAGAWFWDVTSPADSSERGMGALIGPVGDRVAPFVGFCGGAQILAALEAWPRLEQEQEVDEADPYGGWSRLLVGNGNEPLDRIPTGKEHIELAWWLDPPERDASRPVIVFEAADRLFETLAVGSGRGASRQLPSSHYAMIRASAFDGVLSSLKMTAWSEYCHPWVMPGPEPTRRQGDGRCVTVPQAYRSRDTGRYPVIGFQFHPEQRDLPRLAPGALAEERGDGLEVFANAIDLAVESYVRLYWPDA